MTSFPPEPASRPDRSASAGLKVLFFKPDFAWPRASGHDVHTFHMMEGLSNLGVDVGLITTHQPPPQALGNFRPSFQKSLHGETNDAGGQTPLDGLAERFRSYWGVPVDRVNALGAHAKAFGAQAVVVSGLDVLPMLGAVRSGGGGKGPLRVWYAGDEWVWHHLSQVKLADRGSWSNVRDAAIKGLYQRAFTRHVDQVWVVTETDARAMRRFGGFRDVRVMPNGVDTSWYQPSAAPTQPASAIFWGRLDFGPNIQALEWFCRDIWPAVRAAEPSATFTIVGFKPTAPIERLATAPGITLRPNLDDIRGAVADHAVVVLPFVSGGGIKNKLLEAAAMGKPIVASQRALLGLQGDVPVRLATSADTWVDALTTLWRDADQRAVLGRLAREWVSSRHAWAETARRALEGLRDGVARVRAF